MDDLISRQQAIDALHTWFRDGFDEDKWWNSTHVLAAIEGLPSVQQEHKWETCFECPLSHGCPKIKGCTNEQAIEYASQIPNDCPLSAQPNLQPTCNQLATDYISRQQAIDAVNHICPVDTEYDCTLLDRVDVRYVLSDLPSAQPERQKGEWIEISSINHTYKCSECGRLLVNITDGKNNVAKNYPYCHCGADMRGEQDEY